MIDGRAVGEAMVALVVVALLVGLVLGVGGYWLISHLSLSLGWR